MKKAIASAMAHCESHAEIVGVVYGDASRDIADSVSAIGVASSGVWSR